MNEDLSFISYSDERDKLNDNNEIEEEKLPLFSGKPYLAKIPSFSKDKILINISLLFTCLNILFIVALFYYNTFNNHLKYFVINSNKKLLGLSVCQLCFILILIFLSHIFLLVKLMKNKIKKEIIYMLSDKFSKYFMILSVSFIMYLLSFCLLYSNHFKVNLLLPFIIIWINVWINYISTKNKPQIKSFINLICVKMTTNFIFAFSVYLLIVSIRNIITFYLIDVPIIYEELIYQGISIIIICLNYTFSQDFCFGIMSIIIQIFLIFSIELKDIKIYEIVLIQLIISIFIESLSLIYITLKLSKGKQKGNETIKNEPILAEQSVSTIIGFNNKSERSNNRSGYEI